jgi:Tfp pilus assembly protein PilN
MQNINLYQPEGRRSAGPRPRQMLLGLAVLACLLLMHGGWTAWHSHAGAQALAQAEQRSRQVEAELLARQANFQEPQLDARLSEQLAELESGNQRLKLLADHLLSLEARHREGFAPLLAGLAEQHTDGLWLTRIHLRDGGQQMRLEGLAQEQTQLPRYLASLSGSPALQGREFAELQVRREDSGLLRFSLASEIEIEEPVDE